jgi:methionyl aminopeptidase
VIQIKSSAEIALMREAGLVVARALAATAEAVAPGVSTADLDAVAADVIRREGATPNFLNYHGYPATICTSVNEEVVHGIPRPDKVLAQGDIVSIDCGAIVSGYHGDAAVTVGVGAVLPERQRLMDLAESAMWAGLAAAHVGGRLGDISAAVERRVRALSAEHGRHYGIVKYYGGHGIGTEMHQDPHVLNYGKPGRGPRLTRGLALAIEPMVTLGDPDTLELDDGWTVVTVDGSCAAHFEHTVAFTDEGPWVLTAFDGGVSGLAEVGVTVPSRA